MRVLPFALPDRPLFLECSNTTQSVQGQAPNPLVNACFRVVRLESPVPRRCSSRSLVISTSAEEQSGLSQASQVPDGVASGTGSRPLSPGAGLGGAALSGASLEGAWQPAVGFFKAERPLRPGPPPDFGIHLLFDFELEVHVDPHRTVA